MGFLAPALPYLLAGGSAAASALSNRGGKQTSTTRQILSPQQQEIEDLLVGKFKARLADPAAGTEPLRVSGIDRINRRFASLPDRLTEQFSQRGYGASGSLGGALKGVEFARQGAIGDLESELLEFILGREDQTLSLAERFLNPRQTETVSTYPGNKLAGGIGSGVSSLSTLLLLNKLLKPGGGLGGLDV